MCFERIFAKFRLKLSEIDLFGAPLSNHRISIETQTWYPKVCDIGEGPCGRGARGFRGYRSTRDEALVVNLLVETFVTMEQTYLDDLKRWEKV